MPSMRTSMVDPSNGITAGFGVSAQPKFTTVPETVSPWPGVSIDPNGDVAVAFEQVIVRVRWPSTSSAYTSRRYVPLPATGSMLVSTCRPQPARDAFGNDAYIACTSGRAPSTIVALPMNTSVALSPAIGSRYTAKRDTPTSSSAHPVTAIAPLTSVALSAGVSIVPNGAADDDPACAIRIERPPTTIVALR